MNDSPFFSFGGIGLNYFLEAANQKPSPLESVG
jgi:hypothetical protein